MWFDNIIPPFVYWPVLLLLACFYGLVMGSVVGLGKYRTPFMPLWILLYSTLLCGGTCMVQYIGNFQIVDVAKWIGFYILVVINGTAWAYSARHNQILIKSANKTVDAEK